MRSRKALVKKLCGMAGAALLLLLGPNLIWLTRSTARIENRTGVDLQDVRVRADDGVNRAFDLPAGSSRLVLLPDRGDATFSIGFRAGDADHEGCREYVEGSMYHVSVTVGAGFAVECRVTLPLFSELLSVELLRASAP